MALIVSEVNSHKLQKQFLSFTREIYDKDHNYRDDSSSLVADVISGESIICKRSLIKPIMVKDDTGNILTVCVLAIVDRMSDTVQLAFFEAKKYQEQAVRLVIAEAQRLAKLHGANKILVGLNIHVNYGLGLLANNFHKIPSFGSAYNPSYYIDYFRDIASEEVDLVNYYGRLEIFEQLINARLLTRIAKNYSVRMANFKKFKQEIALYTAINNAAFVNHRFYYQRDLDEDLELFIDFKPLLAPENLLFLEYQGQAIGFVLWYPDFNQLLEEGERPGLKLFFKNKLLQTRIDCFKIVEIGVMPEHQKNGSVLALFDKCRQLTKSRFQYCESGWVLAANRDSRGFGIRWSDGEYKQYKAFVIDV